MSVYRLNTADKFGHVKWAEVHKMFAMLLKQDLQTYTHALNVKESRNEKIQNLSDQMNII